MSLLRLLGYIRRLLANALAVIYRLLGYQPGRHPLVAESIGFICEYCGRHGKAPLECGHDFTWDKRGFRICGECLERMCGMKEGA